MDEIVVNLHMHTRYSDGSGSHGDIARAALSCGLDAVIVTDHNAWMGGMDRYVEANGRRLLVLLGEEIHDRNRLPQKDHLIVIGAGQELASHGEDTSALLAAVRRSGGLAFVAHPIDPAAPAFREPDISWEDWSVSGLTGIELWNGFSELKALIPTRVHGIFYAFFPALIAHGPLPAAIDRWDRLLANGPSVAIGGSDAHALHMRSGPLRRTVFPYEYHFRSVNTHVLLEKPLTGNVEHDARAIYAGLAAGRCFIGYDLPRPTRGFRFSAYGADAQAVMGEQIAPRAGVALHAKVPDFAEIRLLKDGRPVQTVKYGQALTHRALEPGVYRIEAYRRYLGRRRAWILSNPIYVR
ncbi:MAG: CehA/McbA family metallohydrolase [Chloroflexota bacterium]